ncbi:hypothetical protein P153DRAFT_230984 [Dothidotthia symphoricarpi CBS 119687]|uniref:Uncharacterized protein n=1 Tax=Dothidotthia symphoricarpi CBS 119687 TaxID=1392245 RepID=A0A6A6AFP1_9PLEO|nr:uncharacterized protein P153DRAFT_230984 [Dothidotthia symphoricarpi CBS 119687]KAF2130113.1 hypothetical protein P153DRAFT_230984 [Dothidotthia symphoricarpi CBS 119687]
MSTPSVLIFILLACTPLGDTQLLSLSTIPTTSSMVQNVAGPLTTPFVAPSYCTSQVVSCEITATSDCERIVRDVTCGSDGQASLASACFPGGPQALNLDASAPPFLYSPGIACPVGWTSNGVYIDGNMVSTIGCCPSTLHMSDSQSCAADNTYSSGTSSAYSCQGQSLVPTIVSWTSGQASFNYIWARQVQVVLDNATPFTTFSSPTSATLSRTASGAGPSITTQPDPGDPGKPGLSIGAIVGIVIGALALILLVAAFFFFRRRKQRENAAPTTSDQYNDASVPELITNNDNKNDYPFGRTQTPTQGLKGPSKTEMAMAHPASLSPRSVKSNTPTRMSPVELDTPTHTNWEGSTPATSQVGYLPYSPYNPQERDSRPSSQAPRTPIMQELANAPSPSMSPSYIHSDAASILSERDGRPETAERGYPSSPLTPQSPGTAGQDARLADLESSKAGLEERMARLRHLAELEEEHARMQAEIERLRGAR